MKSAHGFTLVELLVVISIIAILAVVGVTVFSGVQNNARISSTKEELRRLQQAMVRYKISNGQLPPTGDSCPACIADNTARATDMRNGPLATLIASSNGGPYVMNVEDFVFDAWGQAYYYDDNDEGISGGSTGPCQGNLVIGWNTLLSSGPDKISSNADDIQFNFRCP